MRPPVTTNDVYIPVEGGRCLLWSSFNGEVWTPFSQQELVVCVANSESHFPVGVEPEARIMKSGPVLRLAVPYLPLWDTLKPRPGIIRILASHLRQEFDIFP